MIKRSSDATGMGPSFDKLDFGPLTWIGLLVALIGWVLLLGDMSVAYVLSARFKFVMTPTFHDDLAEVARCLVVSGFGLAIMGALQAGFGTLNRFFGAVLLRSAQRDSEPSRPMDTAPDRQTSSVTPIKRRPYRMFADGSVEVDTIVGTRLFKTMSEARDFI